MAFKTDNTISQNLKTLLTYKTDKKSLLKDVQYHKEIYENKVISGLNCLISANLYFNTIFIQVSCPIDSKNHFI
jgi:hypothetical protein